MSIMEQAYHMRCTIGSPFLVPYKEVVMTLNSVMAHTSTEDAKNEY